MAPRYRIHSEVYERYENFSHIIEDTETGEAIIIDPAWDEQYFIDRLQKLNLKPVAIWLTHGHHDHVSAVKALREYFPIPVYGSNVEIDYINSFPKGDLPPAFRELPDDIIPLYDNDLLDFAGEKVKIILTPGHSSGSICFLLSDDLITGDTLFINGSGRADLPGSDPAALFDSLNRIKTEVPHHVTLRTGHAYGPTATDTLDHQIKSNPYIQLLDNKDEFIKYRMSH
ncbi:MBL fold metallo-hydrolase [Ignatzschineria ureiclastica]|uniref:MBL fold metallo-hydrolase n=1 Tax=Ignatzschineria ureiclastica TaxID=472582 RepID=A0A2U2AHG3_9GAMM|nr:MBL fold metallo-hydrolase [Ignatzschineria ureiclastica]PWD82095.1 MBL fold metallo-hydrolase [Ignatzschineria ureiclastica]GGZ92602.1 putative polyketide biosynthesis zinc-dependent hydrolase PksB [Ignatzschineria ureiclastica]